MPKKMGRYCKAYPITRFREFNGWTEAAENTRKEKQTVDDKEVEAPRILADADHLYLQEDYTVTDGVFLEENVVFSNLTPEWREFCDNTLQFAIPSFRAA
jgi:hypothetical protein